MKIYFRPLKKALVRKTFWLDKGVQQMVYQRLQLKTLVSE